MSRIDRRVVRIYASEESGVMLPGQRTRRRPKLDYAALMRRGTRYRQDDSGSLFDSVSAGSDNIYQEPAHTTDEAEDYSARYAPPYRTDEPAPSPTDRALVQALPDSTAAVARNVAARAAMEEHHIARIAQTIAEFCGDTTVSATGCWSLQIAVDPSLLSQTVLLLSLSPASLSLRFDIGDAACKQLVLNHYSTLRIALEKLMLKSGWPREIDITIW